MEFGIWPEPEMVKPDRERYRAHPDWALQLDGRAMLTARNQLVRDISPADTPDHLFDKISGLLRALPNRYIQWDTTAI